MSAKKTKTTIPIQHLDQADGGIRLHKINSASEMKQEELMRLAHRDSYYVFYLQLRGHATVSVDFKEVQINGNALCYILPGQVHYSITVQDVQAWGLAIDSSLVPLQYKSQLQECTQLNLPQNISRAQNEILVNYMQLLYKSLQYQDSQSPTSLINPPLIEGFLHLYQLFYFENYLNCSVLKENRTLVLTRQFKGLVRNQFKTIKEPKAYAQLLCVSLSYLNDSVKSNTGFPLTYWIQQEIIVEAKRLLYFTSASVKEIAHDLGYTDYPYFSRVFHKISGESPRSFRKKYRE